MDQFLPSHQNFIQNSIRNSKIMVLKILVKKWQKIALFRASKSIFEFNIFIGYFGMFQGFKKATPHGCAWKLRLSHPSVRCVCEKNRSIFLHIFRNISQKYYSELSDLPESERINFWCLFLQGGMYKPRGQMRGEGGLLRWPQHLITAI